MSVEKLSEDEIGERLQGLPGWTLSDGKVTRSCRFADFSEAFAFMTRVAMAAEQLNHHPEWSNVWNRVDIALTTHDAGGISVLDFALAERIQALLE